MLANEQVHNFKTYSETSVQTTESQVIIMIHKLEMFLGLFSVSRWDVKLCFFGGFWRHPTCAAQPYKHLHKSHCIQWSLFLGNGLW